MRLNRKGYTLVELLAVILILGLVVGFSTFGIISAVKSSKNKATIIKESSIKSAAVTFSTEKSNDNERWLDINENNNKYFCTTIEELMNNGLLDKNAKIDVDSKKVNEYTYIVVKKSKLTFVNSKPILLTDTNSEDYKICTGNSINNESIVNPKLNDGKSYTDELEVPFTDATADSGIKDGSKSCLYGNYPGNIKYDGRVEDNKCVFESLEDDTTYYVRVCMDTEKGSHVCSDTEGKKTAMVKKPSITIDGSDNSKINIKYDSSNIKDETGYYYFKSEIKGNSSINVSKCTLDKDIFTCEEATTKEVSKDTWYKSSDKNISIIVNEEGNGTIYARTVDKSNNFAETNKKISVYKTIFNKGDADKINDGESDITIYCAAENKGKCKVTSPSIERNGYEIIGWNTNKDADSSIWNENTEKDVNDNKTYYPITSKVNYVYIKFSTNSSDAIITKNTSDDNYSYTWTTSNNIISRKVGNGTSSDTFFKIKYGSSTSDDGLPNYNYSKYMNITRTGYKAVSGSEWKCLEGCTTSGKTYNQKTVYNASNFCDASNGDCTVTLGVNWKAVTVEVTLDNQGATTDGTTKAYYQYNSAQKMSDDSYCTYYSSNNLILSNCLENGYTINKPTKTGYTFEGYYTGTNGSGTQYINANGSFINDLYKNNTSNITLYAKWKKNQYTIEFNGNGSTSGSMSSISMTYGVSKKLTANSFKKTGYTFIEWNIDKSGNSDGYDDKEEVKNLTSTNGETVTLYAQWKANQYTIEFNGNGSTSGSMSSISMTYGVSKNLTANSFKKTGYTFYGWNSKADGSGTGYSDKASVKNLTSTNNGTVTLYAQWKANQYTIKFNANGGSGAPNQQTKTYGKDLTLSSEVPTRKGYIFKGWSTSSTAKTASYQSGGKYTTNESATLYAVWEEEYFNLNSVTILTNPVSYNTVSNFDITTDYSTNMNLKDITTQAKSDSCALKSSGIHPSELAECNCLNSDTWYDWGSTIINAYYYINNTNCQTKYNDSSIAITRTTIDGKEIKYNHCIEFRKIGTTSSGKKVTTNTIEKCYNIVKE